ncbi:hypothetical protein [Flavobacterium sp. LB2R40]|uniref:hypothetical protein n=1 Tax=unclassified Flavobacterium TaxID=196869 RepID=UPI003AB0A2CB
MGFLGRGDVEDKIRIQNLVFPKDLSIRAENREYLTKKVNGIFELISVFVGVEGGSENEKTHQNLDGFFSVAGNLEKYNEFLDDYYCIVAFATITEAL